MAEAVQQEIKLSPRSLTHLFLTLSRARRKIAEKEKKRGELLGSIEKIKQISEKTTRKSAILDELRKLESQVNVLVEKHAEEQDMLRRLQQKHGIEKPKLFVKPLEDFERISWKLGENVQKLKKVEEEKPAKIEIIHEEKSKINELKQIESQLKIIEARYKKLKKTKQNAEDLRRLNNMIVKYKKTIEEIKSRK